VQLPILRALAMVAVGNAALKGRDVSGFYPNDPLFCYSAALDFMTPREAGDLKGVARGATDWFAKLAKRKCKGLRLHNSPMQQNQKLGHIDERLLVGMVGGGPRWLIEAVYGDHSELWEGFDRVGDQKAADQEDLAERLYSDRRSGVSAIRRYKHQRRVGGLAGRAC
jgi:hypothetical protein